MEDNLQHGQDPYVSNWKRTRLVSNRNE